MALTIDEILVADPAAAWTAAGFGVDADGVCRVGSVRIRLVGREQGTGIIGWSLREFDGTDMDGIPTAPSRSDPSPPGEHANGVVDIDHLVMMSPDLDRTVAALGSAGVLPRRERDTELGGRPVRQIFYRLGAVILEVIGSPERRADGPATLWGITYTVADIDAGAAFLGELTSRVKDAVQPGRRITTLRHQQLGMSVPSAFISAPILGR
ncbi:glyoxalase [Mycolicibacterium neoaurum]|uniref:VOC family protein n=1 Tax=Mycolicibacterium neoaurum TaxID=1795 RepID=UPI002671C213|nr:glyoxalase [Mycolicibacterium neoaurum]MDO3400883.1 glyoxalase [Mycolicibacterium neoaurum]